MIDSYKVDTIPTIENNGTINLDNGMTIFNCVTTDNGSIKGYTINPDTNEDIKAYFNINKMSFFFGADNISKSNLVNLRERTKEERLSIIEKANESRKENLAKKKNFNELAKAMLEQTVSESQIAAVLGDNTEILLDNSVASVILASMIKGAVEGSFKCAEFVRDTAGYKPKNEVEVSADIMTDSDRALIDKLQKRIG